MKESRVIKITFCGLMTAVIAVMSQISIPTPFGIPLTMQTFAICLCGYFLGLKYGFFSIMAFVLLGIMGVPVFSGFQGGISAIAGVTGGYIIGFIFLAVICGCSEFFEFRKFGKIYSLILGVAGLAVCHVCGVIQFSAITGSGIVKAFVTASLPFLIKDVISCFAAYAVASRLTVIIRKTGVIKK